MKLAKKLAAACAVALVVLLAQAASAQENSLESDSPSDMLPLSNSPSASYPLPKPLTFAQQKARFQEEQRLLRMEWNKWIGYSPARPNMNASYMSNGRHVYYIPSRSTFVTAGNSRSWYW